MAEVRAGVRALAVGDVVAGRFAITGIVGKGAMGAVYAAQHVTTHQPVALKFMDLGDADEPEFASRFEQEARVMATLRHPNTLRIYDFGHTDDGAMFMAMELLVGQPLDKVLRENTRLGTSMSEAEASSVGIQVLKSLAEAHANGLVHRDLKPGNVFLTDDGSGETLVKVLDFGIARVQGSALTHAGRVLGTPSYMSPELWQGAQIDARSDLYAVGCLLYCCVTGRPPFAAGDNMMQLMRKHCEELAPDPRLLTKTPLSEAFVQAVMTALAKGPEQRFADARAMRAALEAVTGGAWAGTPAVQSRASSSALTIEEAEVLPTLAFETKNGKKSEQTRTDPGLSPRPGSRVWVAVGLAAAALLAAGAMAWWPARPAADSVPARAPVPVPARASVPVPVPVPVAVPVPDPAPVAAPPPAPAPVIAALPAPPAPERPAAKKPAEKPAEKRRHEPALQMVD